MKTYNEYTDEYLNDKEYIKVVDGVEYLIDIVPHEEEDNPHNLLRDFITFHFIPRKSAIIVNARVYHIDIIYKWICKQKKAIDLLRIPISDKEMQNIRNKHNTAHASIQFERDIARGDIILLKNGQCTYSTGWYSSSCSYNSVLGAHKLDLTSAIYVIPAADITGYVLKSEPDYHQYAAQISQTA
jgi:hypothetical protein